MSLHWEPTPLLDIDRREYSELEREYEARFMEKRQSDWTRDYGHCYPKPKKGWSLRQILKVMAGIGIGLSLLSIVLNWLLPVGRAR